MILHQVALHADDLDRAVTFYTALIGEPPIAIFDPPGLAFFRLGDTRLLIERGAPRALIYLRVDDVRTTVERLRVDGVSIANEPHVIFTDERRAVRPGRRPGVDGLHHRQRGQPGRSRQPEPAVNQAVRADLVRVRASSTSASVVWKLVTRRMVSVVMR